MHPDLIDTQNLLYIPSGLKLSKFCVEEENTKYAGCIFKLNDFCIRFRVAKITPIKIGQFVAFWKRVDLLPAPFDLSDAFDFFVVSVRSDDFFGQFVFPKSVLAERGIISKDGKGGKMAIRVYPPWNKAINRQAIKTQTWQLEYFIGLSNSLANAGFRSQKLYAFS